MTRAELERMWREFGCVQPLKRARWRPDGSAVDVPKFRFISIDDEREHLRGLKSDGDAFHDGEEN